MQLIKALRYTPPSCIAFVGAGGKTTAIFKAARELLAGSNDKQPLRTVFVTTTTHFGAWQAVYADHYFTIDSLLDIARLEKDLPNGVVLLTGNESNNLLAGLHPRLFEKLRAFANLHNLPLLVEADGSHTCPLKAPAEHEPNIPDFTQLVVVVAGLQGLGKPLTKSWVHRPEQFAELADLNIGEIITVNALGKVLLNKDGGLKNIPSSARRIVLLNQADTTELQSDAKIISERLLLEYQSVIIASLLTKIAEPASKKALLQEECDGIHAVIEQIGGIILAAGESSRLGEPKQLLLWKGVPLIRHVASTALRSRLSPVIVITGSSAGKVESVINDLPVRIVNNIAWSTGLSSSIKAGLTSLSNEIGGAMFLQTDQPQIPTTLIRRLVETHEATLSPIIAPQIDGQRGNPVLFDACTFKNLLSLEGDIGGRSLFGRFPIHWVPWNDSNLLMDIDSPQDYRIFLRIYPESEETE